MSPRFELVSYALLVFWAAFNAVQSVRLVAGWRRLHEARDRLTESQIAHLHSTGTPTQ